MTQIETVYRDGVFQPLERVELSENQRVRIRIELISATDFDTWLRETRALRERIKDRVGILPDSTLDIAEDRRR